MIRNRWNSWPATIAHIAASLLIGGIAVVAAFRFFEILAAVSVRHAAVIPGVVAAAAILTALALVMRHRVPSARPTALVLAALLVGLVAIRLAAMLSISPPLVADWQRYHELAIEIAQTGFRLDVVPTGYPALLAVVYRVAGANVDAAVLLNVSIGAATGGVLYVVVRRAWDQRVAAIALLLFATAPSQILMGLLVATEPLYAFMVVATVAVATAWPIVAGSLAAGVVLGASQYVRATSLALLPVIAMGAWLAAPRTAALRHAGVLIGAFLLVLVPVLVWNLATWGTPSLATSRVQNFSLMVGLNQATDGRWSLDDYELVGSEYGSARSERIARHVAIERFTEDPVGSLGLFARKFLDWGDEDYGSFWAAGGELELRAATALASQAWWFLVTSLAAVTIILRRSHNLYTMLVVLTALSVTVVHAVLESQGRYHSHLVPLFAGLAAWAFANVGRAHDSTTPDPPPER